MLHGTSRLAAVMFRGGSDLLAICFLRPEEMAPFHADNKKRRQPFGCSSAFA
jgi:hypothetical protein